MPYNVKIIKNKAYLYGVRAKTKEEYESGNAPSMLIPEEILNNSLFQKRVCKMVETAHEQLLVIGQTKPNLKAKEQELYKKLVLATRKNPKKNS